MRLAYPCMTFEYIDVARAGACTVWPFIRQVEKFEEECRQESFFAPLGFHMFAYVCNCLHVRFSTAWYF